jgi:hypothetical protein
MAQPEPDGVPAEKKAGLQEVADLMLEIYETLAEMRYVQPEGIIRGPHNIDSIRGEYAKHGLDPAIVYLYSIMPYIDTALADAPDFFQGGAFFNHMDASDVERGRDPCYASPRGGFDDEEGEYMHPWYSPLSNCGNHSPIMIYDAREHRMWIVDQIQRNSTDPVFAPGWYGDLEKHEEESNWGENDESSWGEDDQAGEEDGGASTGSSEFWDDEEDEVEQSELDGLQADQAESVEFDEGFDIVDELSDWERKQALQIKNDNSLELARSRDASDVLRDINRWYRELKELPGQGEYTGGEWMKSEDLRPLYLKNGWPDNFDGEGFEVDLVRAYAAQRAKYFAEEPLRKVECFEGWIKYSDRDIERHTQQMKEAKTLDDEWIARFELWKTKERDNRTKEDLRKAKDNAERLCPGGKCQQEEHLPLWEYEYIANTMQSKRERAKVKDDWLDPYKGDEYQVRHAKIRHAHSLRQLAVHEKALEASRADAERLCPGLTFRKAAGIETRIGLPDDVLTSIRREKLAIEDAENALQAVRALQLEFPSDVVKAMEAVEKEVERREGDVKAMKDRLKRSEQWLAKHGNTR